MSFHVTYNFVQGYDAGQKKIVASEMDQNFADIEGYINTSSVNIAETQTITGDKTFTGTVDLSGATVISSDMAARAAHAAMPSANVVVLSPSFDTNGKAVFQVDADGYVFTSGTSNGINQGVNIVTSSVSDFSDANKRKLMAVTALSTSSVSGRAVWVAVSAGDYVQIINTMSSRLTHFCYCNGSVPTN